MPIVAQPIVGKFRFEMLTASKSCKMTFGMSFSFIRAYLTCKYDILDIVTYVTNRISIFMNFLNENLVVQLYVGAIAGYGRFLYMQHKRPWMCCDRVD